MGDVRTDTSPPGNCRRQPFGCHRRFVVAHCPIPPVAYPKVIVVISLDAASVENFLSSVRSQAAAVLNCDKGNLSRQLLARLSWRSGK